MKKSIFIIAIFALISLAGCEKNCEKNYERTIWVNPDVECCGVKNPINNLEWLKGLYNVYNSHFSKTTGLIQPEFFFLFQNSITQENFVVIDIQGEYSSWIHIYDCRGSQIDGGVYRYHQNRNSENTFFNNVNTTPPPRCNTCEEFFKTNVLTDTIAYFIIKPKRYIYLIKFTQN